MNNKPVKNPPDALMKYELCKAFGWLPSQLKHEDNRDIEELLVVMNTISEHEQKGDRKQRRTEISEKLGGKQSRR